MIPSALWYIYQIRNAWKRTSPYGLVLLAEWEGFVIVLMQPVFELVVGIVHRTIPFSYSNPPQSKKKTHQMVCLLFGGVRGIWTLAPLLTAYSLSRGAPSASWVSLRINKLFTWLPKYSSTGKLLCQAQKAPFPEKKSIYLTFDRQNDTI